ncbi:MAG TPA: tRNA pseudouridine(55) synthase TruB [Syntrophorhabdales bacterium]|nr:tRNA pseudouridine(55) synthase TruB [Syntrophorhabdales bacterium]
MMDGFLVINKNAGITSYHVIKRLKAICPFRKIGYIGTLDRNATGILPVALNEGVKLIPFLENGEKTYIARFVLGVTTDTFDLEGTRITEVNPPEYDLKTIEETLLAFKGKIHQKVPVYSSKKIDGKPLYKWVRKGVVMETPYKDVEVHDITFLAYAHPYVDAEVRCSKGTYIRVIAHDFGAVLGCGASLHSLKRSRHGEFTLDMSTPLEALKTEQDIVKYTLSLRDVLKNLREVTVDSNLERFLRNGMPVPLLEGSRDLKNGEFAKLMSGTGSVIGIGKIDGPTRTIRIKRLINS